MGDGGIAVGGGAEKKKGTRRRRCAHAVLLLLPAERGRMCARTQPFWPLTISLILRSAEGKKEKENNLAPSFVNHFSVRPFLFSFFVIFKGIDEKLEEEGGGKDAMHPF